MYTLLASYDMIMHVAGCTVDNLTLHILYINETKYSFKINII